MPIESKPAHGTIIGYMNGQPVIIAPEYSNFFDDIDFILGDTETFTTAEKKKLADIQEGAQKSRIVQEVYLSDGEVDSGGIAIPNDDTIPQITEGFEFLTPLSITPKDPANILEVEVLLNIAANTGSTGIGALFRDAVADAVAMVRVTHSSTNDPEPYPLLYQVVAGSTDPTSFSVRAGHAGGGTMTLNGQGGARRGGGVLLSTIKITELLP